MQPPFRRCLNEITRLEIFGEFNSMNLSYICSSWQPLKISRLPLLQLVIKFLAKKDLLAFKSMADVFASNVRLTYSSINILFFSTISLYLPYATRCSCTCTKVNCHSRNGLEYMDNVINLTFAIVNTKWEGIVEFTSKQKSKRPNMICFLIEMWVNYLIQTISLQTPK